MAMGLPDYYRGVDVAYQSLGQLINRQKFGGAERVLATANVGASTQTTLITVTGKGVLYGGHLAIEGTASQKEDVPFIRLDSSGNFGSALEYLRDYQLDVERSQMLFLRRYDDADFRYSVAFGYGYTFEESISVRYLEFAGNTPLVKTVLHYALI